MLLPRRRRLVALATIGLIALASCTGPGSSGSDDPPKRDTSATYVALGDSAVAGAGIGTGTAPCYRSAKNYPSLLAAEFDLTKAQFLDVSCPGATTKDVLNGRLRSPRLPPQVKAVGKRTRVVTISIGGNDSGYIPALFAYCYTAPTRSTAACRKTVDALPSVLPSIRSAVEDVLDAIQKRAPDAQVVLVSYLRLMPDDGRCAAADASGPPAELAAGAAAEGRLAAAMRDAAKAAGADYVSMRDLSATHSACAGTQAWTSGTTAVAGDGSVLHPKAVGMEAVADAVAPVVSSRLRDSG